MSSARGGFTRTDMVIAIAVLCSLLALLVPCLIVSREDARRNRCVNNLKILALACQNCEAAVRQFPTDGWGSNWLGDSERGTGVKQPGGWLFNILPYITTLPMYKAPAGQAYGTPARTEAIDLICTTSLSCLNCPARRAAQPYPFTREPTANDGKTSFYTSGLFCNVEGESLVSVAKTDYAGNGGQHYFSADTLPGDRMCDATGPVGSLCPPAESPYVLYDTAVKDNAPIKDGTDRWKLSPQQGIDKFAAAADGIFYPFSAICQADITDGLKFTYLCGEKALPSDCYTDGLDPGDNQCAFMGHNRNIARWAENADTGKIMTPLRDAPLNQTPAGASNVFGSPHPNGCNMAFCDGSVRETSYTIAPEVFAALANRRDGSASSPKNSPQ